MLLSEVSLPTCSSPTSNVRLSVTRTQASALVRPQCDIRSHQGHTNSSAGQVGKVLGDKWKALSDKQREPYEKKAAADKKRYEDEKAKYNVSTVMTLLNEPDPDHEQAGDDDDDDE